MDYPENQGREEHGEGACEVNPVKYGGRKGEFSTDKIEQKILRKKVKENSDAREYRCNLPLDSANEIRPVGYLRIKISGTEYVIPYFNAS